MNDSYGISFHDVRRGTRFPTDFRGILRWDQSFAFVRIVDIADEGIRLLGRHLPPPGAELRIGAKCLDRRGRVVWRTEQCCGVLLHESINALAVVRANCFPRYIDRKTVGPARRTPDARLTDTLLDAFANPVLASAFMRGKVVG